MVAVSGTLQQRPAFFNEAVAIASDIFGLPLELNRIGSTYVNHRGSLYAGQQKVADEIIELYNKLQ